MTLHYRARGARRLSGAIPPPAYILFRTKRSEQGYFVTEVVGEYPCVDAGDDAMRHAQSTRGCAVWYSLAAEDTLTQAEKETLQQWRLKQSRRSQP